MIQFYKSKSGLWQSWTTVPKHDSVFQDQNRSVPRLKYKFFHRHVKHCYSKWIFWETKWNHTCYMSVFKPCKTDMNQDSVTDMCATRVVGKQLQQQLMEQPINNLKVYGVAAQILCQPNMLIDLSIPSRILLSEMLKKAPSPRLFHWPINWFCRDKGFVQKTICLQNFLVFLNAQK